MMKKSPMIILAVFFVLSGCATPLTSAVEKRDIQQIKTLLDSGEDINEPGGDPAFPPLILAIRYNYNEIAKFLIERGADVNLIYFDPPLTYAATVGDVNMINLLLEKGAHVNLTGAYGSALANAAKQGKVAAVELLLKNGADLDSALEYCTERRTDWQWGAAYAPCLSILKPIKAKREAEVQQAAKSRDIRNQDDRTQSRQPASESDIDELPKIRVKPDRNAYAIVIGIEQYRQKLPRADYAVADARTVTEYLTKVMGYPEANIVNIMNENATHVDFVKYFEQWLANHIEKGSTLFIYYSGHGAPNPKTGDAYLVPYDGDPAFIEQTGYPLKRLYNVLGKLPAREIIVALDSCFSGAGGRSVLAEGARPLVISLEKSVSVPKNVTVLAAASGDQISSTYKEKGHGLFTYFFLRGIKEESVLKQDGSLHMNDLFDYIKPQVERIARRQYNNEQTPQLIVTK